ncbi:hypothetical protein C8J56DRAFT_887654 [Mycena floridula]|nr:hypothetical protein C8J56DRAFT_887654 [Mycena floridula]
MSRPGRIFPRTDSLALPEITAGETTKFKIMQPPPRLSDGFLRPRMQCRTDSLALPELRLPVNASQNSFTNAKVTNLFSGPHFGDASPSSEGSATSRSNSLVGRPTDVSGASQILGNRPLEDIVSIPASIANFKPACIAEDTSSNNLASNSSLLSDAASTHSSPPSLSNLHATSHHIILSADASENIDARPSTPETALLSQRSNDANSTINSPAHDLLSVEPIIQLSDPKEQALSVLENSESDALRLLSSSTFSPGAIHTDSLSNIQSIIQSEIDVFCSAEAVHDIRTNETESSLESDMADAIPVEAMFQHSPSQSQHPEPPMEHDTSYFNPPIDDIVQPSEHEDFIIEDIDMEIPSSPPPMDTEYSPQHPIPEHDHVFDHSSPSIHVDAFSQNEETLPESGSNPISNDLEDHGHDLNSDNAAHLESFQDQFQDDFISAFPSSSPPSSSPPLFSSEHDLPSSQTTAPLERDQLSEPIIEDEQVDTSTSSIILEAASPSLGNEKPGSEMNVRTEDTSTPLTDIANSLLANFPLKMDESECSTMPPQPKRLTMVSQRLQRQKLTAPFKPPRMKKAEDPPIVAAVEQLTDRPISVANPSLPAPTIDSKAKHRTQKAAGQFKSPLTTEVSPNLTSVRLTPTIQALERKLQVLKRALKVKTGNEEVLEELAKRWLEAGQELAWELWNLVKDNSSVDSWGKTRKRAYQDSWSWTEAGESRRVKLDEDQDSWETPLQLKQEDGGNDEEDEVRQSSLGTMLRQLGISPETLGWDEKDDSFSFV